jgi:hypothetical protein
VDVGHAHDEELVKNRAELRTPAVIEVVPFHQGLLALLEGLQGVCVPVVEVGLLQAHYVLFAPNYQNVVIIQEQGLGKGERVLDLLVLDEHLLPFAHVLLLEKV